MRRTVLLEAHGVRVAQIDSFGGRKHLPLARPEAGVQTAASLTLFVVFAIYGVTLPRWATSAPAWEFLWKDRGAGDPAGAEAWRWELWRVGKV